MLPLKDLSSMHAVLMGTSPCTSIVLLLHMLICMGICLRGTALMWHTAELSDMTRRILTYGEDVDEWIQTLITRFKFQASTATSQLLRKRYIMKNVRRSKKSREYVQKVIRLAKSTEMESVFNQLKRDL